MDTQNTTESKESQQPPIVVDVTKGPSHSSDKILMGILSYLGLLVLIPLLMKKDDPFVKFHIKQGLVLLCLEAIIWILPSILFMPILWPIYRIVHLALFILSVIGIINVVQDKQKELPVVGKFGEWFKKV